MSLDTWQVEAFAEIEDLTFPPPGWSGGAVSRAKSKTVWVEICGIDSVVPGRPSVCPLPLVWALSWFNDRGIDVLHLPDFSEAFVGIGIFPKDRPFMVYDKIHIVDCMVDEAQDYSLGVSLFDLRLSKAYYGKGSPGFLTGFEFLGVHDG